jgi:transcriptional regulator with XRE-family HTH domain
MSKKGSLKLDSMRAQREAAGLTITGLAKKANVSDLTIITLENGGNVDVNVAERIANAMGVTLATLGQRIM